MQLKELSTAENRDFLNRSLFESRQINNVVFESGGAVSQFKVYTITILKNTLVYPSQ